jgi:hypothetical protein
MLISDAAKKPRTRYIKASKHFENEGACSVPLKRRNRGLRVALGVASRTGIFIA